MVPALKVTGKVTVVPALPEILPPVKDTAGGAAAVTVRLKLVVRVTPPPVADTVIADVPAEDPAAAVSVNVVEQLGVQPAGEKEAVTPEGMPEAL